MPDSTAIVAAARGWLGTPWRHQGRTRGGMDCLGLVVVVARELGLSERDGTGYSRRATGRALLDPFREEMDEIPLDAVRPGDVVVFADRCYPCHVGILSERHGALGVIHAHASRRQVIEDAWSGEWQAKARFAFRFRGLSGQP